MKYLDKILLFLTILIVVFNLTQLNIYNFLDDENRIALICFILSLCALILILILMISKKIRDKYRS
jgi:heme O synthase-like polyprenyltransferase